MKAKLTALFLIFTSLAAQAAGAGGHHFPWDRFVYQCINVAILTVAIVYFTRKSIKEFFKGRHAQFVAAANKAQAVRLAAEQENQDIKARLSKLEATAEESVLRARAEAAQMKHSLVADAEATAKRLAAEAEASAKLEIEKAKLKLREQLVQESLSAARSALEKVSSDDHQRLQGQFIENMQAVQR
jgi:F0F1-type ATP synthase membrane subunit b/b'